MAIEGISGISGVSPLSATPGSHPAQLGTRSGGVDFGELLGGLQSVEQQGSGALADLAVGGSTDLHDVVLAAELESLSFDLAVQIRNRLVDAYQEIFRMSV